MAGMYTQDKIENWVSDFVVSDHIRPFSPATKEIAGDVLVKFLTLACDARSVEPEDIEEPDAKSALLQGIAQLALPENTKKEIPALCNAFLAFLEYEGRLGGGRAIGAFVGALANAFQDAASTKTKPIVRPGSKIGRNDPCPCGSGKKYKKCCMNDG